MCLRHKATVAHMGQFVYEIAVLQHILYWLNEHNGPQLHRSIEIEPLICLSLNKRGPFRGISLSSTLSEQHQNTPESGGKQRTMAIV